jgi:hypothetical protein
MKIGFDLDGTLDKPALANLCNAMLQAGHEVHIITGIFAEAGAWQGVDAKLAKLERIGVPAQQGLAPYGAATLWPLVAVDVSFGLEYRLRDLALRKGDLSHKLGLEVFLDDSETYMKFMPVMNGGLTLLHVQ